MKTKNLEFIIITIVLLVGLGGLLFLWQVNIGKAFLQPPNFIVQQTQLENCCCKTESGKYFEIFANSLKDTNPATVQNACQNACRLDHGTAKHPVSLVKVGKCSAR